jgi:hypothetical protein
MVSVPAPREFQYMERSTMIFLPEVLEVTRMEARPFGTLSAMLKVMRELAGMVSANVTGDWVAAILLAMFY